MTLSFQALISTLNDFWAQHGCLLEQPYDMEMGAGTFHPMTTLMALGPRPFSVAYVQPCRRPTDGRYGENPNRVHRFHQYQVLLKPAPAQAQSLFLDSLKCVGITQKTHDIRFVEDDWESPTLGASGLGWEVWINGMEVMQYTYFQQVGGIDCAPVAVELTYGLERLAMIIQGVGSFYDIVLANTDRKVLYKERFLESERQFSAYNFEHANTDHLATEFEQAEQSCANLCAKELPLPAYELCIKASHAFNLLDARGALSVTQRAAYINRVRALVKQVCEIHAQQEEARYG
jgi:glycyl-tRNA synthetase alpha chain